MCRFGPAGNSPIFYKSGRKSSVEVPEWLSKLGLSAYEYQCGRGIRTGENTAKQIGSNAKKYDIELSIHAPYYINFCTEDAVKLTKSKEHLLKTMQLAQWMGAGKVIFHPGSIGNLSRKEAFMNAVKALETFFLKNVPEWGVEDIMIFPETMGKRNQLGTLEEILELCKIFNLEPAVDFAHIHALGQGQLKSRDDFTKILDAVDTKLGAESLKRLHVHFSQIEFGKSGERKHWSTREGGFGPDFTYLAYLIVENNLEPTIICESAGRQAEDALVYKSIFESISNSQN